MGQNIYISVSAVSCCWNGMYKRASSREGFWFITGGAFSASDMRTQLTFSSVAQCKRISISVFLVHASGFPNVRASLRSAIFCFPLREDTEARSMREKCDHRMPRTDACPCILRAPNAQPRYTDSRRSYARNGAVFRAPSGKS